MRVVRLPKDVFHFLNAQGLCDTPCSQEVERRRGPTVSAEKPVSVKEGTEEHTTALAFCSFLSRDTKTSMNYRCQRGPLSRWWSSRSGQNEMSRADLADVMGGRSRVSDFFKGKRELSRRQIEGIRDLLGIPADLLL